MSQFFILTLFFILPGNFSLQNTVTSLTPEAVFCLHTSSVPLSIEAQRERYCIGEALMPVREADTLKLPLSQEQCQAQNIPLPYYRFMRQHLAEYNKKLNRLPSGEKKNIILTAVVQPIMVELIFTDYLAFKDNRLHLSIDEQDVERIGIPLPEYKRALLQVDQINGLIGKDKEVGENFKKSLDNKFNSGNGNNTPAVLARTYNLFNSLFDATDFIILK